MSSLDRVLGNERIKEYFQTALRLNRISHSYIIEGEKGSGKKMLAECFSRMLQCEEGRESECGHCLSCLQIDHGNHPDVIHVIHEKPKTIGIGEVREQIVNTADIIPYRSPRKIYIVDEAEKMTVEAQNALLKTIEEPPEYVVMFLLVTSRGALLETIQSRCVLLQTMPVRREAIRAFLMNRTDPETVDPGMAEFASGYAMGNVGRALEAAASEEFAQHRELALKILRRIGEYRVDELAGFAKSILADREGVPLILDLFLIWFRDLLLLKMTGQTDRMVFSGEEFSMQMQCDRLDPGAVDRILREIRRTGERLESYVNAEAAILILLTKIKREFDIDDGRNECTK